jgi:hypothetical protein
LACWRVAFAGRFDVRGVCAGGLTVFANSLNRRHFMVTATGERNRLPIGELVRLARIAHHYFLVDRARGLSGDFLLLIEGKRLDRFIQHFRHLNLLFSVAPNAHRNVCPL